MVSLNPFNLFRHQYQDNPIQNILDNDRTAVNTPDILLLEEKANHLVFLYCDRQRKHPRALDVEKVWDGYTDNRYLFWKHDVGKLSHPIATNHMPEFRRLPFLPIRGEVVRMRTSQLVKLDVEKENRVKYRRVRVKVNIPHEQEVFLTRKRWFDHKQVEGDRCLIPCVDQIEAWMYVGVARYWRDLFDGGYLFKQGKVITPNSSRMNEKQYYFFPPNEYP